jgi:hypothetical protein
MWRVDRQQVDAARGTLGARRGDIAPDTSSIAPPAAERSGARRTYNAALAPLGRSAGRQQIERTPYISREARECAFDTLNTRVHRDPLPAPMHEHAPTAEDAALAAVAVQSKQTTRTTKPEIRMSPHKS